MVQVTLVLNAGGRSRRMGQNKALLRVPPHNHALITVLAERLQRLEPHETIVITDDAAVQAVVRRCGIGTVLPDAYAGLGPSSGIATALRHAPGWTLVVACDMPLLAPSVLARLIALAGDAWDAVVPYVHARYQTMHALYHPRCLPAVEAALARGERRVVAFYDMVRVRTVAEEEYRRFDPHARSLINVNTPEEWMAVVDEAAQRGDVSCNSE